jgi:hypothetical protein
MNATLSLPKINITSIKIDENFVPVPTGLSELLANTWTTKRKESNAMKDYNRSVIKKDGHFVTVLTKKRK